MPCDESSEWWTPIARKPVRNWQTGRADEFDASTRLGGLDQGGCLPQYLLKLYVTGSNARAQPAVGNLRRICERELAGQYDLEIIDVLEHPQIAEDEKILATPTLIKQLPLPLRRVIGDLSDADKVLLGLEVVRPLAPARTSSSGG